jgi:G:T-mismatch repair DNA endonuclease (very short patch repair protein)
MFKKELLINNIKRNGVLILARERITREVTWFLENGEIIKGQDFIKEAYFFEIECSGIKNYWVKNKKWQNIWLKKPYYSNKFHIQQREPTKHSEETKKLLSKLAKERGYYGSKNPMYGKTVEEVWREKYSKDKVEELKKIRKEKISYMTKGEKNPFYGKKHNKDIIFKIVEKSKQTRENRTEERNKEISAISKNTQKKIKEKIGYENYIEMKRKAGKISRQKSGGYKINRLEEKMLKILTEKGYDVCYSFILNGEYQYDFRIKNTKILIEVQGDFWHANSKLERFKNKENLYEFQKKIIIKDEIKKEYAKKFGWDIIYIWETEINNNNFDLFFKEIKEKYDLSINSNK